MPLPYSFSPIFPSNKKRETVRMNKIWLSIAVSCLHVIALFGQEDERFDRLRMEDLIGVPALKPMQAPGLLGLPYQLPTLKSPLATDYFQSNRLNLNPGYFPTKINKHFSFYSSPASPFLKDRVVSGNAGVRYQLKGRFSLFFAGSYYTDRYKSPMLPLSVSNKEVEAGVSYQLTERLQLKTGMQYRFNIIKKQWEWAYMSGVIYSF